MKKLLLFLIPIFFAGCKTVEYKEFYPPTEKAHIFIFDKDGGLIEIRGALKSVNAVTEFDLGTEGLGTYSIINFESKDVYSK
jgi:hypothetical protein